MTSAVGVDKCFNRIKLPISLQTCATYPEQLFNTSTMIHSSQYSVTIKHFWGCERLSAVYYSCQIIMRYIISIFSCEHLPIFILSSLLYLFVACGYYQNHCTALACDCFYLSKGLKEYDRF